MAKLSLTLWALVLMCASVPGQVQVRFSPQAEQVFSRAVELYRQGRAAEASAGFEMVIQSFPPNQRTTAAYIMRAKSLLRLDEPLEAGRTLHDFFTLYPTSSYLPDAQYTMGLMYIRIQRFDDALQSLLSAWRSGAAVQHEAFAALDRLTQSSVSTDEIRNLVKQSRSAAERAFFWVKIGEKEAAADRSTAVEEVLDTLYRNYPDNPYRERTAALRKRLEERSNVKIGVLLPLLRESDPSALKEIGNDVDDGIQYAVDEYSAQPGRVKVTLETRDTEHDVLVATRGIQELTSDIDVIGIIGPVFSNEASAAAPLANRRGCPLISPTANANGIAAAGKYVFQANPDYDTRGRAMARYAIEKKGYHVLAVLAPVNSFGKFMGEAFAAEAIRLGARVVATEWYERGAADLKSQMASIRQAGLRAGAEPYVSFAGKMSRQDIAHLVQLGVPMKTIDSLMNKDARIKATELLGSDARHRLDSLGVATVFDESTSDSLEYPVTAIDAIYVPISSSDEIGIVSSQIVYYNIQAQLLGSGEWNNPGELDANRRYCKNVIFESDSYVDAVDSAYGRFVNAYFDRFKKKPGKNTLYGYDTAAMVLSAIRAGGTSRESLTKELSGIGDYRGFHGKISFSSKRVNTWVWILHYDSDRIEMIDGFHVE